MTVSSAPMPPGIRTPKSKSPMPFTNGVYKPSGIRSVEKLIPGAITLIARQKPQNRYQPKFGVISTDRSFNMSSKAKSAAKAMAMPT